MDPLEIDHPLEIGIGAAALDEQAGDPFPLGDERRDGGAEADAVDHDAVGIDPGVAGELVERLAIVADLGIVIERAASQRPRCRRSRTRSTRIITMPDRRASPLSSELRARRGTRSSRTTPIVR